MEISEYKEFMKQKRGEMFKGTFDRTYTALEHMKLDKENSDYFRNNASEIITQLRGACWTLYQGEEKEFTRFMLSSLVNDTFISNINPADAIFLYIENYQEHLYQLFLSNTQSRRSRAGKEFECLIEIVLRGSGVEFDSQASVGRKRFSEKSLGKLVDCVSPSAMHYLANKRNTVLISAKTTLRERWQEVPEEVSRTGASEMFLATLDENISSEVFQVLYESNIQVVTTRHIKQNCYPSNPRVLSFEDLIDVCLELKEKWAGFKFKSEALQETLTYLDGQIEKYENYDFIRKALSKTRIDYYTLTLNSK